ncbi:MAG: S8/S53 family peptidase [Chitinophagales bacterium]|nr:S8/S53 family peptidase [Chitinophagales bacterium]
MKFLLHYIFYVLVFLSYNYSYLNAQDTAPQGYYLYVEALPTSPLPQEESPSNTLSTSEELNNYFDQYNVTQFIQSFPNAQNPELAHYYEIHAEGDITQLKEDINEKAYFGKLFLADYPVIASCPNPVGINDYWITQNWANNYALNLIEAQCAWTITTGNNVEVAVVDTEIDTSHEDLTNQILRTVGPPVTYAAYHGTITAGMVAAQTNNNKGIASIGYNTKISFYRTSGFNLWQRIWQAYQDGARIINVSWSGIGAYPNLLAVKEMITNGTLITLGAGNTPNAMFHSAYAHIDGAINVSGVDAQDNHGPTGHAHNSHIDLCAPSINVTSTYQGNTYGGGWGTSFAAPQVAGTAALMRSVNPCLAANEIENMLKVTCDPIADESTYPGLVGAGRLNAYRAVEKAQAANSTTLDLYIKDRYDDFGISGGYHWQATRDNSPDIWVRNQADGLTNHTHQDPEYQSATPVYVYVRVRNKSCDTTKLNEVLRLYWSKASTWSSWPQNWDGSSPLIGNVIDSIPIPRILPGRDTILEFTWNILNPNIHNNWATCLLARIEESPIDPITTYPNRIDDDVYFNNNIALKNITVIDSLQGINSFDETLSALGRYLFIGNPESSTSNYDIRFSEYPETPSEGSLSQEAEIKIYTDQEGWQLLLPYVEVTEGIEVFNELEKAFLITEPDVRLQNVDFGAFNRIPIYVGFNFLTEAVENDYFTYQVQQFFTESEQPLGGEYFYIYRNPRPPFYAYAGEDQTINIGSSALLEAEIIDEPAIYNWYNSNGALIHQGTYCVVEPSQTETYQLEVISIADGYKDYDDIEVRVIKSWINSIAPNPASGDGEVHINYQVEEGKDNASIMILNQTATSQNTYPIDPYSEELIVNSSSFTSGAYTVNLIVEGIVIDSKTLIIQ